MATLYSNNVDRLFPFDYQCYIYREVYALNGNETVGRKK